MTVIVNRYIANMSFKNSGCAVPVGALIGGFLGIIIPISLVEVSQGMTGIFVFMALVIFGGIGAVIGLVIGLIIAAIGVPKSRTNKIDKKTNRTNNIIVIIIIFLIVVLIGLTY